MKKLIDSIISALCDPSVPMWTVNSMFEEAVNGYVKQKIG